MSKDYSVSAAGKVIPGGFFIRILSLITLFSWIIRLIAAWEMAGAGGGINNIFTPPPTSDLATYMSLGRECAAGNFPAEFYYQPYYYAVFLAAIYFICGNFAVYAVIFIQSVLSAATVFLTGLCGRKIFTERAGLLAAGMAAISSSLILYVPYHQNETLQTFHLILLFYLTLNSCERQKILWWMITGIIAGIAILTRGNIWLLLPVISAAAWFSGSDRKSAIKNIMAMIFFMLLVQLPFIIHNSRSGTLRGASTAADAVLALGNGIDTPAGGREAHDGAGAMYYSESYRRMMTNTRGEYASSIPEQMWKWFLDDPAAFLELQFRKALLFWDGGEIPNNVSLQYDGCINSLILRYLIPGRNYILLALGAGGIFWFLGIMIWKREWDGKLFLLYGFTFAFYISVVIFYILSRFKAPLLPLLSMFAGGAVCQWHQSWKDKSSRRRIFAAMTLLAGVWLSTQAYDFYRAGEKYIWKSLYPDGVIMDLNGENILHFDHGPKPFGGWQDVKLQPQMTIVKHFSAAGTADAEIQLLMRNRTGANVKLLINGRIIEFTLPPQKPGKSDRKMVKLPGQVNNGALNIHVLEVSGGEVWWAFDRQRDYGRSWLNGKRIPGEWVIRAGLPRSF